MAKRTSGGVLRANSSVALLCACLLRPAPKQDIHHHVRVHRIERRQIRLEFSFRFLDVNHLRVHSSPRSKHRHLGFRVFLVRSGSKQVEEETLANPNTIPSQQLRQSLCFVASASSQCLVQFGLQRRSSSCCGLSCLSTQLPVQCFSTVTRRQELSRVVLQVPVCPPKLSQLLSTDCSFRDQFA